MRIEIDNGLGKLLNRIRVFDDLDLGGSCPILARLPALLVSKLKPKLRVFIPNEF